MPAPVPNGRYYDLINNFQANLTQEATDFLEAHQLLEQVTIPSTIPDTYWQAPNGVIYHYKNGIGEIELNSHPYSSCESVLKRKGHENLDQFIIVCMKAWAVNNNL